MNWQFFQDILSIDSTSGKERALSDFLATRLRELFPEGNRPLLKAYDVGDGTQNLLFTWGSPRIVFCSHQDTVPPYFKPEFPEGLFLSGPSLRDPSHGKPWAPPSYVAEGGHRSGEEQALRKDRNDIIKGRGSCDAKGQIFAMVTACQRLAEEGQTDFGLLLVSGEETGSWGAKAFAKTDFRAPYLVVGEPTDNCMVSASKGTKSFDLTFTGEAFHSGYPQYGVSAVNLFVQFMNLLKEKDFGTDPLLGDTTWNVGLLSSDNPQNILSPELTCRLYFRTTFVSDALVSAWMQNALPGLAVSPRGGDTPARYWTVEGLPSKAVSFGSDAPHLTNFTYKAICGPGSVLVAHRDDEHILRKDLETAVEQYITIYHSVL